MQLSMFTNFIAAYQERNRVVQALAKMAMELGYKVGIKEDPEDYCYVILYIDLPTGQVSWHIDTNDLVTEFPTYEGQWDSHDTNEKYARLEKYTSGKGNEKSEVKKW